MPKSATRWLDYLLDEVHLQFVHVGFRKEEEVSGTADFYIMFVALTILLSVVPLACYFSLSQDPHVVHWLGKEPQYVNLCVPVLLVLLVLLLPCLKFLHRRQETVRVVVLLLFVSAAAAMITASVLLMANASQKSNELLFHCGHPGTLSAALEAEWRALEHFHRNCTSSSGSQSLHVQQCPGFAGFAAKHAVSASYLQSVEDSLRCSGFCRFWAVPLFSSTSQAGHRCASALGSEMGTVGSLAALPTLLSGCVLFVLGLALAAYEHL